MSITVKQARILADKTQQEMADLLGIHIQTYWKMEKDPSRATVKQAKKISEITGVSVEEMFFAD